MWLAVKTKVVGELIKDRLVKFGYHTAWLWEFGKENINQLDWYDKWEANLQGVCEWVHLKVEQSYWRHCYIGKSAEKQYWGPQRGS